MSRNILLCTVAAMAMACGGIPATVNSTSAVSATNVEVLSNWSEVDLSGLSPLADFAAMSDVSYPSSVGDDGGGIEGVLVIEERCVYIWNEEYERLGHAGLTLLSLPRAGTRYDELSGNLWVWASGPFRAGNSIVANGPAADTVAESNECAYSSSILVTAFYHNDYRLPETKDEIERSASSRKSSVDVYAEQHGVSENEAARRIRRIDLIYSHLNGIRAQETERFAGLGIDHTDELVGWVCLAGEDPPSKAAQRIASKYNDIEIRIGVAHTHAELRDGRESVRDRRQEILDSDDPNFPASFAARTSYLTDNMAANALKVGISFIPVYPGQQEWSDEEQRRILQAILKAYEEEVDLKLMFSPENGSPSLSAIGDGPVCSDEWR